MKIKALSNLFNHFKKVTVTSVTLLTLLVSTLGMSMAGAANIQGVNSAATPVVLTATYTSIASQDGWVLESTETSKVGLTANSTASTLILGDDAARKQYRSIFSFNTSSLPDTAVITSVSLKVKQQSIVGGGNPVSMFAGFMADVKTGTFGLATLRPADFQTAASATYGPLPYTLASSFYTINLTNARTRINKLATGSGLTQIRLRFKTGDNNNAVANYLKLFSGNTIAGSRPQLIVKYYVNPATLTPTRTKTVTLTPTVTSSSTPTVTDTVTQTSTAVATGTETSTPTNTLGASPTVTLTLAETSTPTETATVTETATTAGCGVSNFALGKTATSSSNENGGVTPNLAVDGNTGTRWASAFSDPQWIQLDLGAPQSICRVKLNWEAAYGSAYQIQVSDDATSWTTIYSTNTSNGGIDDLTGLSAIGRYIRMYGTVRALPYGYSLWEFEVYVGTAPTLTPTPTGPTVTPTVTMTPTITNTPINPGDCGASNMAINRPATASSGTASLAVDALGGTRWESTQGVDPQWIQLDFGSTAIFCRVVLNWETAAASAYQIQTSDDASTWTTVYNKTGSTGGTQDFAVEGLGRYIRMYGTARTTSYGYSLWEFEVYGSGGVAVPTITPVPTIQSGPVDFGPNVVIFDSSMSDTFIQDRLNLVFSQQQTNQFGDQRDALLFKPGTYAVDANIGFNTQISGLGFSPDDVVINGAVRAEADWFGDNGTQNFWRIAENMKVVPTGGTDRWAVSQAAPFRRMHIAGGLQLDPRYHGWSSGGFIADSKVDGQVSSGSQQQYLTRNSQLGSWVGSNWNMVFVGVNGAPAQSFPSPAMTTINQTPSVREKPFLYVDGNGDYFVFVPGMQTNSSGTTWYGQTPAGTSLPISQFYIVKSGATATDINNALAAGKDLLITPGVYHLDQTINITRADTVVLGMGLATLINDGGIVAMHVDDVDGVKIAGILFDAGTTNTTTLLEVGATGASADHSSDPMQLSDVFIRVGGAVAGKVDVAMTINSNNVIIDHTWIWRADHGAGIGWSVNTANNGLVVNGNDVTIYGLFVEHFQQYNVLWNGNGGRTYFFQNEMPYDPPNQAAYMNGAINGYAAYKVADTVTTHEAWGLGSYCYFNVDPTIINAHGFEVPDVAGVQFHSIFTISLGNNGIITNVINSTGAITPTNSTISPVVNYP